MAHNKRPLLINPSMRFTNHGAPAMMPNAKVVRMSLGLVMSNSISVLKAPVASNSAVNTRVMTTNPMMGIGFTPTLATPGRAPEDRGGGQNEDQDDDPRGHAEGKGGDADADAGAYGGDGGAAAEFVSEAGE